MSNRIKISRRQKILIDKKGLFLNIFTQKAQLDAVGLMLILHSISPVWFTTTALGLTWVLLVTYYIFKVVFVNFS